MKRDEIIEMAKQAGMDYLKYISEDSMKQVEAFAKLVAEAERKECAKVAAEWVRAYPHPSGIIENNILARGQKL